MAAAYASTFAAFFDRCNNSLPIESAFTRWNRKGPAITHTRPLTETEGTFQMGIIDCDVHPSPRSTEEIKGYMPMPWRDRYQGEGRDFYRNPVHGSRLDSGPPDGGPAGSDPNFLREQL